MPLPTIPLLIPAETYTRARHIAQDLELHPVEWAVLTPDHYGTNKLRGRREVYLLSGTGAVTSETLDFLAYLTSARGEGAVVWMSPERVQQLTRLRRDLLGAKVGPWVSVVTMDQLQSGHDVLV